MTVRRGICPECGEQIDRLDYHSNVDQWGVVTCDEYGLDYTTTDSDTHTTDYRCPECDHDISYEHVRIILGDEEEEEELSDDTEDNNANTWGGLL